MADVSDLFDAKTKIVATAGPATETAAMLERLARAGVDVFRLNSAHGDRAWHDAVAGRIREVSRSVGKPLAILQDLAGPKIRLGELPGDSRQCALGERFWFVRGAYKSPNELTVSYPGLIDDLREGDLILLADGTVAMRIVSRRPDAVEAEVTVAGEIRSRQGINAPGVRLQLEALTEKDLQDLDAIAARGVDFIGLSFVRRPEDVDRLRKELEQRRCDAQVVAKIEKAEALDALDQVLVRSDVIMVARGDLGVEIDIARVPIVQKQIIERCSAAGLPVITATQMLESMRTNPRPTRAEATDVANAILDGTDAVMLSAETATGLYPVEAVQTMQRIAQETESYLGQTAEARKQPPSSWPVRAKVENAAVPGVIEIAQAAVEAAGMLADRVGARLVVAATHGGHTAVALSKQRNRTPTLGLSDQPATVRRMALYWGVIPVLFEEPHVPADYVARVTAWARREHLAAKGDRMVFVFGSHWADGRYNTLLVHEVD